MRMESLVIANDEKSLSSYKKSSCSKAVQEEVVPKTEDSSRSYYVPQFDKQSQQTDIETSKKTFEMMLASDAFKSWTFSSVLNKVLRQELLENLRVTFIQKRKSAMRDTIVVVF